MSSGVILSTDALNRAQTAGQELLEAVGGTFSGNAGWFVLAATIALIAGFIFWIMVKLARLGR